MSLELTVAVLVVALGLFAGANWGERRDRARPPGDPPSLIPFMLLQMVAVVAVLVTAAHLLSWLTGAPFQGRMGW